MIKVILFDCDGPIIKREKYFSQRLKELGKGLNDDLVTKFFREEFLEIEKGKADLKRALEDKILSWGYKGTVKELMDFWFEGEAEVDQQMKNYIISLRKKGIKCYLATNNEKYRTEYLWNVAGLKDFLDGLFSSCYSGYLKPQIEYWEEAYKNLSVTPKNKILFWDNLPAAVESAKRFGFNAEVYNSFEEVKKIMAEKYFLEI
jgi:putative hydrolase of the HAD superfamily